RRHRFRTAEFIRPASADVTPRANKFAGKAVGFVGPNSFGRRRRLRSSRPRANISQTLFYDIFVLKTIGKIGNSEGLILDAALRELTGLKAGDRVNLTVHEGGTIVITPMRATSTRQDAAAAATTLIRRHPPLCK